MYLPFYLSPFLILRPISSVIPHDEQQCSHNPTNMFIQFLAQSRRPWLWQQPGLAVRHSFMIVSYSLTGFRGVQAALILLKAQRPTVRDY